MVTSSTMKEHSKQVFVTLEVEPLMIKIRFKIDTGVLANVLPKRYLYQIKGICPLLSMKKSSMAMEELKVKGKLSIKCRNKGMSQYLKFYIVDTDAGLVVGFQSCLSVSLIKLVLTQDLPPNQKAESTVVNSLSKEFRDVFKGIGLFSGSYKITLKVTG